MSLREEWPSLSPRERDARVAVALGGAVAWLGLTPENQQPYVVWPDGQSRPVQEYTSSWEHAGPLLDKLREEGWTGVLTAHLGYWLLRLSLDCTKRLEGGPCRWTPGAPGDPDWCYYCERLKTSFVAAKEEVQVSGEDGPSAIALAFCLSREAA